MSLEGRRAMLEDERDDTDVKEQRRRLEPHDDKIQLRPFVRATKLTDISLYWLPVTEYPMRERERNWMLVFMRRLKSKLASDKKLRLETFLQFKALYPDLLNKFLSRSQEYQPLTGLLLQPGSKPPEIPTFEDMEAAV